MEALSKWLFEDSHNILNCDQNIDFWWLYFIFMPKKLQKEET